MVGIELEWSHVALSWAAVPLIVYDKQQPRPVHITGLICEAGPLMRSRNRAVRKKGNDPLHSDLRFSLVQDL